MVLGKTTGLDDRLPDKSEKARVFMLDNLTSQRPAQGNDVRDFPFEGRFVHAVARNI